MRFILHDGQIILSSLSVGLSDEFPMRFMHQLYLRVDEASFGSS
jgi:hypothetical protein